MTQTHVGHHNPETLLDTEKEMRKIHISGYKWAASDSPVPPEMYQPSGG